MNARHLLLRVSPFFLTRRSALFQALYNTNVFSSPYVAGERSLTHAMMTAPARRAASWASKTSLPVYLYKWAHRDEVFKLFEPAYLIGHSS